MFAHQSPHLRFVRTNHDPGSLISFPPISLTPLFATHTNCSQITENTTALSPFLATHTDLLRVSPVFATHTKTTGVHTNNSHSGTRFSSSPKIVALSFHAVTNCSRFPREEQLLCFHALTNCPFRKPFVLTFMHRMGGVGGSGELSSRKFSTNTLSALD